MKLPKNYTSQIGEIINPTKRNSSFFISDWDMRNPLFYDIPNCLTSDLNCKKIKEYYFINEMSEYKDFFVSNQNLTEKSKDYFAIFPNGTTAASITLDSLIYSQNASILLISPIYFTYIDILQQKDTNILFYQALNDYGKCFKIDEIYKIVCSSKIDIIILTDPLFGTGVSLSESDYKELSNLCIKLKITLMIDYIYGGMPWNIENINLIKEQEFFCLCDDLIILRSLSKNLFLNGAKTCLVYAPTNLIKQIEKESVFKIGSFSYSQINMFKNIYSKKNATDIRTLLCDIVTYCQKNYELILSIIASTDFNISPCQNGIFCLLGIPKKNFYSETDDEIAEQIENDINIITIPHSRYLFYSIDYYWFRVNLSLPQNELLSNINKLTLYYH